MNKESFIQRYQNAIIIGKESDRAYFEGLKKDIPSLQFSYFSVEEIIAMFSYSYDEGAVNYLRCIYEFEPSIAEETLLIVSLLGKDHYSSHRLNALLPLRDELLKEGLLHKEAKLRETFEGKNILYFRLKTALPISLRLGELRNMALSFDILYGEETLEDPELEKYRILTSEEKQELGLYL